MKNFRMKKTPFLVFMMMWLTLSVSAQVAVNGKLPGLFSIYGTAAQTDTIKIQFSQGNLQYQASTDTWRFAENQYDYVGAANSSISASYSGWIDLFNLGTGNNPTQYNSYSTFVDWGTNAISNGGNKPKVWRTLNDTEWEFLLSSRKNAANLRTLATVNSAKGLILLPDNWVLPSGVPMTITTMSYATNNYNTTQWGQLEAAGAVFLPAAGWRSGTSVSHVNQYGYCWAAGSSAKYMRFRESTLDVTSTGSKDLGFSVRLVSKADPLPAFVSITPTANELTYNGSAQELVTAGTSVGGIMHYKVGNGNWSPEIPTAIPLSTYPVYYKVVTDSADLNYIDSEVFGPINASINPLVSSMSYVDGKLPGGFSIYGTSVQFDTIKVNFSQGNLQYQASTGTWRFASAQWDFVGDATFGNVAVNGVKCNNANVSGSYSGWIDLFYWGTGNNPTQTSANSTFVDWGINAISNGGNTPNQWRTLSGEEWEFLLSSRQNAANLRTLATVNAVQGLILLPDNWVKPSGVPMTITTTSYATNTYNNTQWEQLEAVGAVFLPAAGWRQGTTVSGMNQNGYSWSSTKVIDVRYRENILDLNSEGVYYGYSVRLVSKDDLLPSYILVHPTANTLTYTGSAQDLVNTGTAVGGVMHYKLGNGDWSDEIPTATLRGDYVVYYKVVADIYHTESDVFGPINVTISEPYASPVFPNGHLPGSFSITDSKQINFSQGNLQYQASTDTWRFAEYQFDFVGDATTGTVFENNVKCNNENISASYSGWIDLFNWGTGNNPTHTGSNSTFIDWGTKAISNGGNTPNQWFTLTGEEWEYLLTTRANADILRGLAQISLGGDPLLGMIILPDDWMAPDATIASKWAACAVEASELDYSKATFTKEEWLDMESAGAVFLPSAGIRSGTTFSQSGQGNYWTATSETYLDFDPHNLRPQGYADNYWGFSVRLAARPAAQIDVNPTALAESITYDGSSHVLINGGTAFGGTLLYSLDGTHWSSELPTGINAGNYTVYYMVEGDAEHADYTPVPNTIEVTIHKANITPLPTVVDIIYDGLSHPLLTVGVITGGTIYYSENGVSWNTNVPEKTAVGTYDVWYKIDPINANYNAVSATKLTVSISCPEVFDNIDPTPVLSLLYNAGTTSLVVNRTIYADGAYNTICLPFDITQSELSDPSHPLHGYALLKSYRGAQVSGNGQDLHIDLFVQDEDHIEAGVPYLITYNSGHGNIVNPTFTDISVTTITPSSINANGVTFQGLFAPHHITTYAENVAANSQEDYLFLGAENQLVWPNNDGTSMRGFRAYFIIHRNEISAARAPKGTRVCIVDARKTTTEVENLQMPESGVQKIMINGQLILIKNGVWFNAQGQVIK